MAKLTSVKVLLSLAAKNNWHLEQLDVHNAFLIGKLNQEIYIELPPGLSFQGEEHNKVCKLNKSLYGLKQASREWNSIFSRFLTHMRFTQSKNEYSLFTKKNGTSFTAILVYVDDIILAGSHLEEINEIKQKLKNKFKILSRSRSSKKERGNTYFTKEICLRNYTTGRPTRMQALHDTNRAKSFI